MLATNTLIPDCLKLFSSLKFNFIPLSSIVYSINILKLNRLVRRYLIVFLVIVASSCSNKNKTGQVNANIIEYRVEYLHEKAGSIPTRILPDQMTVIFAYPYALNNIEGFFGQFSLSYVANLRKRKVTTLLKLFDKKYYYEGEQGEIPCGVDPMEGMSITPGNDTKTIAGYRCHEYILARPGKENIPLYSTDELHIKSPNITTPYLHHNDVLLQFYTRLSIMDMLLVADSCRTGTVKKDLFMVPDGYQEISRVKMEKVLDELFK